MPAEKSVLISNNKNFSYYSYLIINLHFIIDLRHPNMV